MKVLYFVLAFACACTHLAAGDVVKKPSSSASLRKASNGNRKTPPFDTRNTVHQPTKSISRIAESAIPIRGGAVSNTLLNAIAGSLVMALIEFGVKRGLKAADIQFPAMLGGCIFLFTFLLATNVVAPSQANNLYEALTPAATFLTKWLPPFFVPGLVMLPLSPSVGGNLEIAKVIATVGIGFIFTLSTATFSVVAIRKALGQYPRSTPSVIKKGKKFVQKRVAPKPKPFDDASANFFYKGTLITGVASLIANKLKDVDASIKTPLEMVFLAMATMSSYIWGANLPADFVKVVHPLVTGSIIVLILLKGLAAVTDREFESVLRSYKVGSLNPTEMGAGDLLLYLLGPSVVSFAVSMYSRRQLLQQNLIVVLTAVAVSSAGSLFATAGFVRAIALGASSVNAKLVRLSVLSRNITTALAMALTAMIEGDISIAASVVCLTGILGGTYGKSLLDKFQVNDPISRGLGMGCSSQGLGVAAMADEPDAFPFAAIAMVLTAIAATSLVAVPSFKQALVDTATGGL